MKKTASDPVVYATGLIALDLIGSGGKDRLAQPAFWDVGGSCGNVMSILSYMGCACFPFGRLGADKASSEIRRIWKTLSVHEDYLTNAGSDSAPIIMHYIKGNVRGDHRFDLRHPITRDYLPRYRPVTVKHIEAALEKKPTFDVAYIDRINPGALALITYAASIGALVMVEPRSIDQEELDRILPYCDLLKLSNSIDDLRFAKLPHGRSLILLETMGESGMRTKLITTNAKKTAWISIPAYPGVVPKDTAGAGDWTSAYLLYAATASIRSRDMDDFKEHLLASRNWSALAIQLAGARGLMHHLSPGELKTVSAVPTAEEAVKLFSKHEIKRKKALHLQDVLKRFDL